MNTRMFYDTQPDEVVLCDPSDSAPATVSTEGCDTTAGKARTWDRSDYATARFAITDGPGLMRGAPPWRAVFRRVTRDSDGKVLQDIRVSNRNRYKQATTGLLPCGQCDTVTTFYYK